MWSLGCTLIMVSHETAATRTGYGLTTNFEIKITGARRILNLGTYSSLQRDLVKAYVKVLFQ